MLKYSIKNLKLSLFILISVIFIFFPFIFLLGQDQPPEPRLPHLKIVEITTPPDPGGIKEWLFRNPKNDDVIGIKVLQNQDHLSPLQWYRSQGFTGNPQAMQVDGYEAIRDGTTIYVGAANIVEDKIYTNIYIFSYNRGASNETIEIFNQLIKNLRFNINLSDEEQRICKLAREDFILTEIKVKEKWHWGNKTNASDDAKDGTGAIVSEPKWNQVMMTPLVADLNKDGISEVIFNTFRPISGYHYGSNGILRVVRGDNGKEVFSITDPQYYVLPGTELAIGDIDLDGYPEIIATHTDGSIIVFEHDGEFKWKSQTMGGSYRVINIANIDKTGPPEIIIFGQTVLNNNGTIRWRGEKGGSNFSTVANINLDGYPEVVSGKVYYKYNGNILWSDDSRSDGFIGVANFDNDLYGEVVVVGNNRVRVQKHNGVILWEALIPGRCSTNQEIECTIDDYENVCPTTCQIGGGPPTIANYDSDPEPEIGIAGAHYYIVFDNDGKILWKQKTKDFSSRVTGSSVFDFNNDGEAEVLYNDEHYFRIYRSFDGKVLTEIPNPSGTLYENPVVADVDGDGQAEIVLMANNYAFSGATGIRVFEDEYGKWVETRPIWNQHTYHITNVNDDGTIPLSEENNWQVGFNNFRLNQKRRTLTSPILEGLCNKDGLRRDIVRLEDLVEMRRLISQYKEKFGYFPKLEAGTYLKGQTLSTWPSWQAILANELGEALPTDPINELGECPDYNPKTCWNEKEKKFAGSIPFNLPNGSFVYSYSSEGNGIKYKICATPELGVGTFKKPMCYEEEL